MRRSGIVFAAACALSEGAHAESAPLRATFEPAFLRGGRADLARFERGMPLEPGVHVVELRRDGRHLGRHDVRFVQHACVDTKLAEALGIALARLSREQRRGLADASTCIALESLIPGASAVHDPGERTLDTSIPHAALAARAGDVIDPAHYDRGIPAFRLAYGITALHRDAAIDDTQATARLEAGLNAGPWRLRHRGTVAWRNDAPLRSQTIAATLERDATSMEAQVLLGDFHTRGALFDTIALRGVRMQSDERMWPASRTSAAPIVRGIAATHARVQVRQGDVLLLDAMVPPGPFALDDLRPVGLGGALDVRVVEADGHVATFAVPHAALPGTLRSGQSRFSVAAGRWRNGAHVDGEVVEATWEGGVGDRITTRVGAQVAHAYAHALGGLAWATRIGAMSLDLARSHHAETRRTERGTRLRIGYAGHLAATGTTVDVATWRHGSADFRSLHDALHPRAHKDVRERGRLDARLQQDLRSAGTLSLGYVERRYGPAGHRRSAQWGWGVALGRSGASLHGTFERALHAGVADHALLSLSLPLRIGEATHAVQASTRMAGGDDGAQIGANGRAGRDGRVAWGIGALRSQARGAFNDTLSGNVALHGNGARLGAGVAASSRARHWSTTLDGGVLLHARGVTLAPAMGDSVALLHAAHGAGARVLHDPRVRLDRDGDAVVPHLSPYRRNRVGIDPRGADAATQFAWTERDVVPRAGAVVSLAVPTTHAPARWLRLVQADGTTPPFAADIFAPDEAFPGGMHVGRVGREGIAWVRARSEATHLDVRWQEDGEGFSCRVAIDATTAGTTLRDAPCERTSAR